MIVKDVKRQLHDRMKDIVAYLRLLQFIEKSGGTVFVADIRGTRVPITQPTIHVMKAGVFLHLYNLVESTVTQGLGFVADSIRSQGLKFQDLDDCWKKAWVVGLAKLDEDLSFESRVASALKLSQSVADGITVEVKPKFGVGNLDDKRIEDIAKRHGISIFVAPPLRTKIKRPVLNDMGCLGLVREQRNGLAHGEASFADTGKNYSVGDLVNWSWVTYQYLKCLLGNFEKYVSANGFLRSPP